MLSKLSEKSAGLVRGAVMAPAAMLDRGPILRRKLQQAIITDVFPRPQATLDLDFANRIFYARGKGIADSLAAVGVTYTNASGNRSYFDKNRTLQYADVNEPIFDHDPTTGRGLGLGSWEARTGLLKESSNFYETSGNGDLSWIYVSGTISNNTQIAPDASTTADTLTTTGAAQSIYQSASVSASTVYTASVYVKLGTLPVSDYKIAVYNNTSPGFIAVDVTPSQTPTSGGWTRIVYTFTTPAGCTSVRFYLFRNSATITSGTVHLWGAQLEAGASASPYIPTAGTAVTRSADVNSQTVGINPLEGSAICRFVGNAAGSRTYFDLNDGTANERVYLQSIAGALTLKVVDGGVEQCSLSLGSVVSGTAYTVAAAWKLNDFAASINGAAVVTDSAGTLPTVTTLKEGMDYNNANHANSTIARTTLFSRRLGNSTLQGLAT